MGLKQSLSIYAFSCFLLFTGFLLSPFGMSAHAADDDWTEDAWEEDGGEDAASQSWVDKYVTATFEYKFFGHFYSAQQSKHKHRHEGNLELNINYPLNESSNIELIPVLQGDSVKTSSGIINRLEEKEKKRYILNLKEAYYTKNLDNVTLSVGKKIYSWGKASAYNPTDSLNPNALLNVPDRSKIGVLSASTEYITNNYTLDFVYIPFFTPSRLPEKNNRWAGNTNGAAVSGGQFNQNATGVVEERDLPLRAFSSGQLAGRLSTSTKGWDIAISYYHGFDSVAGIEKNIINGTPHFTPKFNKIQKTGLGVATTFGKLEAHIEAAYRTTEKGKDDDFIAQVFGGNYAWSELGTNLIDEVSLYLEYASEIITRHKSDSKRIGAAGFTRPFKNSLLSAIKIKFNEDTDLRFAHSYNFAGKDHYFQSKLSHKLSDSLKLDLVIDIFTGKNSTFWGKWSKNDRVSTMMTFNL